MPEAQDAVAVAFELNGAPVEASVEPPNATHRHAAGAVRPHRHEALV